MRSLACKRTSAGSEREFRVPGLGFKTFLFRDQVRHIQAGFTQDPVYGVLFLASCFLFPVSGVVFLVPGALPQVSGVLVLVADVPCLAAGALFHVSVSEAFASWVGWAVFPCTAL